MVSENQRNSSGIGSMFSNVVSQIKGFFHKSRSKTGEISTNRMRTLSINRKDSIVSVFTAIIVMSGAIFYGMKVMDNYNSINNRSEELKNLNTYKLEADKNVLFPYLSDNDPSTIIGMTSIYKNVEEDLNKNKSFEQQQQSYYEIFLQNIYLPSLNVRKNPYTKAFDVTLLGQRYLESDKFQDLFLIQYRSDFVKYVGNDADYNEVENISIGDKVEVDGNKGYFYTPISISFASPNKRSFLLLVNKLSLTSTQSNVSLINEFFFYLIQNIKSKKIDTIEQLEQEYRDLFSSNYYGQTLSDIKNDSTLSGEYRDNVLGYSLNLWLNGKESTTELIDNEIMVKTIRDVTLCNPTDTDQTCFYNFRSKYRNIPYLAYKVGLDNQNDRVSGLWSFLNDLPPVIAIKDFSFEKKENSILDNNNNSQYEGRVSFNAYGRNITEPDLEESAILLGKLCFGKNGREIISIDNALDRVNKTISEKGGQQDYSEYSDVTSLRELKGLLENIKNQYGGMSNYNKMIKLFEIWRMLNDANLCIN